MSVLFYEYAACSSCKNAKKWLQAHKVAFTAVPIVDEPPSLAQLKGYWKASGLPLKKLFNTSGQSYRALKLGEKLPKLSDEEALTLLAGDGKLIKRPLLVVGKRVLVGFDAEAYAALLAK
jgi:arsenate reductase